MSKFEELIQKHCPDGVEYKPLKEVLKIKNGRDYKHLGEGAIPVYGSGGVMTYVDTPMYSNPSVLIPRKGSIDKLYYVDTPFWNVDTVFYTEIDTSEVVAKYVFYVLQNEHLEKLNTAGGVPSLTQGVLNEVFIPVPPLPVQEEIVRVFDTFTELQAELQAELQTELQNRLQQYNYYRDNLLSFEGREDVTWKKLGEVATVTKLAGFEFSEYMRYSEAGSIIALRGLNVKNGSLDLSDVKYIDNSNFSKLSRSKLYINDMLYTYVGTVGQVALVDENDKYYLAPNVALIRLSDRNILPKFLTYFFLTESFKRTQLDVLAASSSMKNITMEKIRQFNVPLLPVAEQQSLIDILDRFNALALDLSQGLSTEIEKRRQQYEYYRDKLLTFKRKEA